MIVLNTSAQSYLLSFAGTGAATTISTVKVENLRSGDILLLNGSDILQLSITTDISETKKYQNSGILIYQNPMSEESVFCGEGGIDIALRYSKSDFFE